MTTGASLSQRGAAALDVVERTFVALFLTFAGAAAAAMALAWIGRFTTPLLIGLSIGVAAAALGWVVRSWRRERPPSAALTPRAVLAIVALTLLTGGLYFMPARYHYEGVDGSVYVALAGVLADHGTLTPVDSLASTLSTGDRDTLFPAAVWSGRPERFPGGIELDMVSNRLSPEFLHLFPVLMAAARQIAGPEAGWYLNPILAVAGVLVIWLLGRRLAGPLTGEIAASLLAINVAQIWFARFPSSEVLAQFLVVSGVALALIALDTRWTAAGAAAGVAFGLLAFTRIDVLLFVAPVVVLAAFVPIAGGGHDRPVRWMAVTFATLTTAGGLYAATRAQTYTWRVASTVADYVARHPTRTTLAVVALLIVLAGIVIRLRRGSRAESRYGGGAIAAAVVALALVAWLLWRDQTRGQFAALMSPVGVVAMMAGLAAMVRWPESRRAMPIVLVSLFAMGYLGNPMDVQQLPWNLRRSVPVLLPLGLLAVAFGVRLALSRGRWGRVAGLVPLFLALGFARDAWPIVAHAPMRNGTDELSKVASVLLPASLTLWGSSTASHVPLAVHYGLARESLIVPAGAAADAAIGRVVRERLAAGRPVQLVVDEQRGTVDAAAWPARLGDLQLRPLAAVRLRADSLRVTGRTLGFRVAAVERRLDVYAVEAIAWPARPLPLRIDIGGHDMPFLLAGFHGSEERAGTTYRWTADEAQIQVPALGAAAGCVATLTLRAAAGLSPAWLDVAWNDRPLARVEVSTELTDIDVLLADVAFDRPGVITLRTATFVPQALGRGPDTRALGVLLDSVTVR